MNRVRERLLGLSAKVWGGTPKLNTTPAEGVANAKNQIATKRWAAGGTALPSEADSIKVSDGCLLPSSGGVATAHDVNTATTEGERR